VIKCHCCLSLDLPFYFDKNLIDDAKWTLIDGSFQIESMPIGCCPLYDEENELPSCRATSNTWTTFKQQVNLLNKNSNNVSK
jgi:hypothetical protein